jgi:hypothetical protein
MNHIIKMLSRKLMINLTLVEEHSLEHKLILLIFWRIKILSKFKLWMLKVYSNWNELIIQSLFVC